MATFVPKCWHFVGTCDLLMLIKVKPKAKMDGSCTRTSYFVRLLLKICFFPVDIKGEKVKFSFLSWKTLIHLAFSFGVYSSLSVLGMYFNGFFETIMDIIPLVSLV